MAGEDTALVEKDTGDLQVEATDVSAEAADLAAAEIETPEGTETETPTLAEFLKEVTEEELADIPAFKSVMARREESARQKAVAEAERRIQQQNAQWLQSDGYVADVEKAAKPLADGEDVDRKALRDVFARHRQAVATEADQTWVSALNGAADTLLPKDYRPTVDLSTTFVTAPSLAERLEAFGRMWAESHREEIVKEVRAEVDSAQKTARLKAIQAARNGQPRPTGVAGQPAGKRGPTPAEYIAATPAQRQKWFEEGIEVDLG